MTANETLKLIAKQWCNLSDLMKLAGVGRNNALIIKSTIKKKLESERKLARTRENIARLKDILIEIERQLNPLKQQAEKARKYLELKEQLKSLEINNYIYQYDNAAENKTPDGLPPGKPASEKRWCSPSHPYSRTADAPWPPAGRCAFSP